MKIQLEQLDLTQSWPTMRLREGYHAICVLVRLADVPVGQVLTRPAVRREVLPHRLARLIAQRLGPHLLRLLAREGLIAGPNALADVPRRDGSALSLAASLKPKQIEFVREELLKPEGLPEPYRSWPTRAAQVNDWPLPPVTVAVCTRDRADQLERCITYLRQLDYPDFDILIVDNSADPAPTHEVCARLGVGYVRVPKAGLSRARNAALARARSVWVAFTDDDCRPEPNWLRELVRPLQHTNCRCVTGLVLPAQLENIAEITFEVYGGLGRGFKDLNFDYQWLHNSRTRPAKTWDIGAGANMLLHAEFALESGGFDEDMGPGAVGGCGEDTDVFYRILHHGYTIHYTPRAIVHHYHRSSPEKLRRHIYSYAVGHAAYHWRVLFRHRDLRSLMQLGYYLPRWFRRNLKQGLRGRTRYPFSLVFLEVRGTIVGPIAYSAVKLRRFLHWLPRAISRRKGPRLARDMAPQRSTHDDVAGQKSFRVA